MTTFTNQLCNVDLKSKNLQWPNDEKGVPPFLTFNQVYCNPGKDNNTLDASFVLAYHPTSVKDKDVLPTYFSCTGNISRERDAKIQIDYDHCSWLPRDLQNRIPKDSKAYPFIINNTTNPSMTPPYTFELGPSSSVQPPPAPDKTTVSCVINQTKNSWGTDNDVMKYTVSDTKCKYYPNNTTVGCPEGLYADFTFERISPTLSGGTEYGKFQFEHQCVKGTEGKIPFEDDINVNNQTLTTKGDLTYTSDAANNKYTFSLSNVKQSLS